MWNGIARDHNKRASAFLQQEKSAGHDFFVRPAGPSLDESV